MTLVDRFLDCIVFLVSRIILYVRELKHGGFFVGGDISIGGWKTSSRNDIGYM